MMRPEAPQSFLGATGGFRYAHTALQAHRARGRIVDALRAGWNTLARLPEEETPSHDRHDARALAGYVPA